MSAKLIDTRIINGDTAEVYHVERRCCGAPVGGAYARHHDGTVTDSYGRSLSPEVAVAVAAGIANGAAK